MDMLELAGGAHGKISGEAPPTALNGHRQGCGAGLCRRQGGKELLRYRAVQNEQRLKQSAGRF